MWELQGAGSRVSVRVAALLADVAHGLVLALTRRVGVREDDIWGFRVQGWGFSGCRVHEARCKVRVALLLVESLAISLPSPRTNEELTVPILRV